MRLRRIEYVLHPGIVSIFRTADIGKGPEVGRASLLSIQGRCRRARPFPGGSHAIEISPNRFELIQVGLAAFSAVCDLFVETTSSALPASGLNNFAAI